MIEQPSIKIKTHEKDAFKVTQEKALVEQVAPLDLTGIELP